MAENIVFLLGAGASKDAGLPLMADLTAGFPPWLSAEKPPDEIALRSLFEAAVGVVSPPHGVPNIELVLQLLSDLNSFKSGPPSYTVATWKPPFDAPPELVLKLAALIREYIRKTLSEAPARAGDYLHGLLDFRGERPIDVFTLNYDRLVESMAARFEVKFTTGFGETWDPSLFGLEDRDLRLYKLHGSVDWYRLTRRNVIYRGSSEHPAFPGETAQDVLLYPARGKAAHADPFATLMSLFNRALSAAQFCIAIGYSFRDPHIRRAVLDRMATNRSLQLLIVNPNAHDVINLPAADPEEPTFAQFADRVSGLWMAARYALENRAIRQRLAEILSVDAQLTSVARDRNARQFEQAATQLLRAIEHCRMRDLPYKPVPFFGQPAGAEFQQAIASRILAQVESLRRSYAQFERTEAVPQIAQLVAFWALAAALAPSEVAVLESELRELLRQYASRVVFLGNGEYHGWLGGLSLPDQDLVKKRASDLEALAAELENHAPHTALAVAAPAVRARYEVFKAGVAALAFYYKQLAAHTVGRIQVRGEEFFVPKTVAWQTAVAGWSDGFLNSKVAETWLPPPPVKGPQRELVGL